MLNTRIFNLVFVLALITLISCSQNLRKKTRQELERERKEQERLEKQRIEKERRERVQMERLEAKFREEHRQIQERKKREQEEKIRKERLEKENFACFGRTLIFDTPLPSDFINYSCDQKKKYVHDLRNAQPKYIGLFGGEDALAKWVKESDAGKGLTNGINNFTTGSVGVIANPISRAIN
jgi:hypothetical protein